MAFEFSAAGRLIFGARAVAQAGAAARALGSQAFVVTGRSPDRAAALIESLAAAGVSVVTFQMAGEPDVPAVERGRAECVQAGCDLVIGFGGGSAIDAAKAIGALAANSGDPLDYLEVVGHGRQLTAPALPCIAIPTTAGTGSETTRNAVLGASGIKVSLRHASLLPRVAIVDPDLSAGLPASLTATTGLDALTQLIEAYVSSRANPMTDALCSAGIPLAASALPAAVRDGSDRRARADMSLASFWSGAALANAGLGAVHGFAGPIGGRYAAPHGAICAALLPHVIEVNLSALRARAAGSAAIGRFDDFGRAQAGRPAAGADHAAGWTREITATLEIRGSRTSAWPRRDVPALIDQTARASGTKANRSAHRGRTEEILERAL